MRNRFLAVFLLACLACAAQQQPPEAPAPAPLGAEIEAAVGARVVDGDKSFGFQSYRDIPRGVLLRKFDFRWLTEGNPVRFDFRSLDLLQRDQNIRATLESVGRHKLQFNWDGFTRYWSNHNPMVLTEVRQGVFTVPAGLRQTLENASDPVLVQTAANAVANSPQIEIRSFRERGTLTWTYDWHPDLRVRLQYMGERRSGNRLMSQGTYNRIGTPNGDTFETPGQELFEPTRYGTHEVAAQVDFHRGRWLAGFEYRGSLFYNSLASVTWQNPFRLTAMQATQPAGALLRGRFNQTQPALAPDNQAHTFSFNALVLLPRNSKASAVLSYGRWTQDDAFLPFTINDAIAAPNLPAGVSPKSLEALPQRRLHGLVHTINQDYAATTRPFEFLQLTARYNDYDLNDETEEIRFPGYATFGDSFWRTEITGQPGTTPLPIQSEPKEFHRRRFQVESAVRPFADFTWKTAYRFDRFSREHRQADHVDEHGFLTSLSAAPFRDVFMQGGFRYFSRSFGEYDPGTLEPPFLRMFDQAERTRVQGDALASLSFTPALSASGSWFYISDVYDKTFYGLHQVKTNSLAADLTWSVREHAGVFAGWGYDRMGYDYLSVAKTAVPYDLRNTWARDTREGIHSAHAGVSGSFLGDRGLFQANYSVSLARTLINTVNPNPIVPADRLNAQAFEFPEVKSRLHELRLDTSYRLAGNLRVGLYYLLEPYRLNDFARDTIEPYAPQNIAPENDARRFMFLDVGPTNYTGHMVVGYLRFTLF